MTRRRKFRPYQPDPVSIGEAMNAAMDRDLARRDADDAADLARLEPEIPPRERGGIDHSTHQCNNDPSDPWSECTTDRPW